MGEKRLYRSKNSRMLCGVCGGMLRHRDHCLHHSRHHHTGQPGIKRIQYGQEGPPERQSLFVCLLYFRAILLKKQKEGRLWERKKKNRSILRTWNPRKS